MKDFEIVQRYYDRTVLTEWNRLSYHGRLRPEFVISSRYLARYVKPGDRVLDLGGGPGRYSIFLAERGCDVTLADLSGGNVAFAQGKARERGVRLRALEMNALDISPLAGEQFDHVLCMGPLYHLLEEGERRTCVQNALSLLRPGGVFFAAFIHIFAGMLFNLKEMPQALISGNPVEQDYRQSLLDGQSYRGDAFTRAMFTTPEDALALMADFPLEKLHLLACEGILSPNEPLILQQPEAVYQSWLDLGEQLCERADLLSYGEHFMYVGRKAAK